MHPFYDQNRNLLREKDRWWIGLVSMLMYLLFWGVVVIKAIRMLKSDLFQSNSLIGYGNSALKILSERYARGEIDFETYNEMKENLQREPSE